MGDRIKDSIDIKAPAATIFEVATDFETYPEWSSSVKKVEIKEQDGEGRASKVWMEVDAKLRTISYTLGYDYTNAPESFSWDMIEGTIKALAGSYTFDEFEDFTEVTYEMEVDPGFPVPGFLKKQAEKQIARTALEELKKRVESL